MPLDPFLIPLAGAAAANPFPDPVEDWDGLRANEVATVNMLVNEFAEPGPAVKEKRTVTVPVTDGEIDLNIFWPFTDGPHPVHFYFHGGGWVAGSIHTDIVDITCQERAIGADCIVVTVEYRKAPQHPFPTAVNDVHEALLWVTEHADELGIRADAITVGGGSAGANLAAALTLKVRNEGGPPIIFQLLEVPALDLATKESESRTRNAFGYGLDERTISILGPLYLSNPAVDARNPYASPLLASDLSNLPPAHIMSSEFDPLADDGKRYAKRLNDAGVPAQFYLGLGHIHGSSAYTKTMESARVWRNQALDVLRNANQDAIGK